MSIDSFSLVLVEDYIGYEFIVTNL